MSLLKEEKITLLTKLEERIDKLHKLMDQANCTGLPASDLGEAIYALQDTAIVYAEGLLQDESEWTSWYFYECKRTGLNKVTIDKKIIKVKSVTDLVKVIDWERDHHEKDFGTKWNKHMDELGAERATPEDLRSI